MALAQGQILLFGVGINDAGYPINPVLDGKRKLCRFYACWQEMLRRAYSPVFLEANPAYAEVACAKEWLVFSRFRSWMETQPWEGRILDKDLLLSGNKLYSPETSCFISSKLNSAIQEKMSKAGDLPTGIHLQSDNKNYKVQGPSLTGQKYLGYYPTLAQARKVYGTAKGNYLRTFLGTEPDSRVDPALKKRIEYYLEDY